MKTIIDLSLRGGLVDGFQGDINETSPAPHKRYLSKEGQAADGVFNPIINGGYLSPANNKFAAVTGATNALIVANEYDSINDVAYFAESGSTIWKLDGLDDTSLTADTTVAQDGTERLVDMEIYEINGTRCLFYSYNLTDNVGRSSMIGIKSLDSDGGVFVFDGLNDDQQETLSSITGVSGNTKLAQIYQPETSSITFNRVIVPIARASADDAGYNIKLTIQDSPQSHSIDIEGSIGGSQGPTGGFLSISDAAQTGLDITGDLTIECWVNFDTVLSSNGTCAFVSKHDINTSKGYFFGLNRLSSVSYLYFWQTNTGPTDNPEQVAWTPTAGRWYHVAVTRNGTTGDIKFYVDGVQQGSTQASTTSAIVNSSAAFVIGSSLAIGDDEYDFDGKIDEVRVWNIERTASQILNNRYVGLVGNESGLKAYYRLNNSLLDETSNNNDLTNNGLATFTSSSFPVLAPDGTVDATSTISSSNVSKIITNGREGQYYIVFDLDTTLTKSAPFSVVIEPTTYGDMGASDSFSWFGDDDASTIDIISGMKYNGTLWTPVDSSNTDFDFALMNTNSQTWSFDVATGALSMDYDADIFMCKSDNGFMYVFEGNKVHQVDGTLTGGGVGTISSNILRFPSYFVTTDAVDTRGRMYIAVQANPSSDDLDYRAYSEGICGVYVWDRQSEVFGMRDFLPLYGVRDIKKLYVDPTGDVRAICIGEDRFVQIRSINSNGQILKKAGISAFPETRDSLKTLNDGVVWLAADGYFYWHGRTGLETDELFKIGSISSQISGALTTGSILVGNEESTQSRQGIIFSVLDGTTRENYRWYPHGIGTISSVAQTGHQGDIYTPVKLLPTLSTIRRINLFMLPGTNTGSTTVCTVKIYFNQSTTAWASKTITLDDCKRGWKRIEINQPNVNSIQLEFEYNTSLTLGTDDFRPTFAELEYDPRVDD